MAGDVPPSPGFHVKHSLPEVASDRNRGGGLMAPRGRKSSYSDQVVNDILTALSMGASEQHAAFFAGISEDTFQRWEDKYADFAEKVKRAKGRRAVKWLAKIEQAADNDWRAAHAKLMMCEKDTYGKEKVEQQITGKDGEPFVLRLEVINS